MKYQPPTGGDANDPYVGANPAAGIVGSRIPPKAVEHHQRELVDLITKSGLTPSEADLTQVAQAVQSGKLTYAVATGTANAWVVAPVLAVPAYSAGRVLWVKVPATNTSTTVTVNVSGLGARPLKKADGTDPAIGDFASGRWYPTIDDGTNICVVATLDSDVRVVPLPGVLATGSTAIGIPSGAISAIGAWGTVAQNTLVTSTFVASSGILTVGAGEGGWWLVMAALSSTNADTHWDNTEGSYILKNGATVSYSQAQSVNIQATGLTAIAIIPAVPGDVIRPASFQFSTAVSAIEPATSFFSAVRLPSPPLN